jgi:peptide/nickel transport system substrate-binding protein
VSRLSSASVAAGLVALAACQVHVDRGNTVIMASGADLQSMNSLVTTHPLAKQVQRYALLTTLVRLDSALTPVPYLARRWAWSADRRELTLWLYPGLAWDDGRPTTADDAAWTLEAAVDPATGYPRLSDLAPLEGAVADDDTTLTLRFREPQSEIPDVLSDLAILPWHLLGDVSPAELRRAAWNEHPVGNGPFRFVTHEANRRWVFEANPDFPPALGGPPAIDRLVIAVVDEPMTKLAALTSGELDFAGIQPAHASFVRKDPDLRVLEYPLLFSYAIVFNTRTPPFDDWAARKALDLAIDRQSIVQGYLFGFGQAASGPLPPELDSTPPVRPFYAPGRGQVLLGDEPLRFELLTVGSGEAPLEQMIQSQLAAIGVKVTIRPLELSTFLGRVYGPRHDFEAAVVGISGDLQLGYLRSLLDVSGLAAPGRGRALLPVYADSLPAIFLYHARGVQGMNRRVRGVRMDLRGELVTLSDWTVSP